MHFPKIELHCHLDGSARIETIFELSQKYNIKLPVSNSNELKSYVVAPESCASLDMYLECFDIPILVMQTKEALSQIAYELMEDNASENVKYIEIRFAPLLHTQNGLSLEEVIASVLDGIKKAEADFEIKGNLIISYQRNVDIKKLYSVIDAGSQFLHHGVVALDLCASENSGFVKEYIDFFHYAHKLGYAITVHAGETGYPNNVEDAIKSLKAVRIGHGVAIIKSEEIKNLVKASEVTLEICPTSNIQTKAFASYNEHPVNDFMKEGIKVVIGTDNRTVSNTTLTKEYDILVDTFGWTKKQLKDLYIQSIQVSFADDLTKDWLKSFYNLF